MRIFMSILHEVVVHGISDRHCRHRVAVHEVGGKDPLLRMPTHHMTKYRLTRGKCPSTD
ncbi:hypothetical protein BDE02_19G036400 [Populus trichocarpa]|nr:hypothetical protein BDE02_19G036400 [Populus trichocarpa]